MIVAFCFLRRKFWYASQNERRDFASVDKRLCYSQIQHLFNALTSEDIVAVSVCSPYSYAQGLLTTGIRASQSQSASNRRLRMLLQASYFLSKYDCAMLERQLYWTLARLYPRCTEYRVFQRFGIADCRYCKICDGKEVPCRPRQLLARGLEIFNSWSNRS